MGDQELSAWILPVADDVMIAIGRYELKYIEHINTTANLVDCTAKEFFWRGRTIPVLNIAGMINANQTPDNNAARIAAIVAYEDVAGELLMGVIFVVDIPQLVKINSRQSVAVEVLPQPWPLLAHAAFSHRENTYPVINLSAIFCDQCGHKQLH